MPLPTRQKPVRIAREAPGEAVWAFVENVAGFTPATIDSLSYDGLLAALRAMSGEAAGLLKSKETQH